MRLRAGHSGIDLALLSRLSAARGTTNRQTWVLPGFHGHRMQHLREINWSIVTVSCFHAQRRVAHLDTTGSFYSEYLARLLAKTAHCSSAAIAGAPACASPSDSSGRRGLASVRALGFPGAEP